ncbi:T-cell antigen CD7-like [Hoplias malabaricus]|uniref:T-cell antigen CD7-like n=1 Tax=Hoplias malabaricus TaxID=27720 RepID=UPI003462114D
MKGYQTGATMTTACVTLCFAVFLLSAVVTADFVTKNEGENLTMSCSTDESFSGLYLDVRRPEKYEIFYYDSNSKELSYTPEYKERVTIKGDFKNLTVTLNELNLKDSGAYTCRYSSLMNPGHENGASLLFVKAKDGPQQDEH